MANDLNNLLNRVERFDRSLASELRAQISTLARRREFGLNFEKHKPETVELYGRAVRVGDKVRLINPRGQIEPREDTRIWRVQAVTRTNSGHQAHLLDLHSDAEQTAPLDELVVVADFRDPIYPGLRTTGAVRRGGDKPHHVVINAENFHALEAMLFTSQGAVDAIYIDPPYNTGAKDWKYNNDYVDGEDAYRHSKWLSFMERRLKLAHKLLDPNDSVLIVTIDEKEYLRLGLLLDQIFPGIPRQMVTIVINPNGVARGRELARVEEYAFFLFFGEAGPARVIDSMLDTGDASSTSASVRWERLMRGGSNSRRQDRPNLFYPIFVEPESLTIKEIGEPLALHQSISSVRPRSGLVTVWPVRSNGEEANWRTSPEYLRQLLADGFARVGSYDRKNDRYSLGYLGKAQLRRIQNGAITVVGRRDDGSVILENTEAGQKRIPKTVWNRPSHKAGEYGSALVKRFTGGRPFPFPKSLYAVEDALRIAVAGKPNALVVDFFAGSGTTAHAVMRLNRQDQGRRRTITITNNEVGVDEQRDLARSGHRPGDPEWEALGICDYITKPRIEAAITGMTPEGGPVRGDYRFTDPFPMADGLEENVEFFTLTYEDPRVVGADMAFESIAPLLWMRAGARGEQITTTTDTYALADTYGVLFAVDAAGDFAHAVAEAPAVEMVFIVTDDEKQFQRVAALLPARVETVRLYESYLRTFEINTGKE